MVLSDARVGKAMGIAMAATPLSRLNDGDQAVGRPPMSSTGQKESQGRSERDAQTAGNAIDSHRSAATLTAVRNHRQTGRMVQTDRHSQQAKCHSDLPRGLCQADGSRRSGQQQEVRRQDFARSATIGPEAGGNRTDAVQDKTRDDQRGRPIGRQGEFGHHGANHRGKRQFADVTQRMTDRRDANNPPLVGGKRLASIEALTRGVILFTLRAKDARRATRVQEFRTCDGRPRPWPAAIDNACGSRVDGCHQQSRASVDYSVDTGQARCLCRKR